jgi:CMP-N,N'-diacetyllegionaminic acid synthase
MEILAVIPARGGSKGLPDKNIRLLAGHPLIAYSIKAALDTPSVSRVIVSTDSPEIAAIAKTYGAEVPFMRPEAFAQDLSTDIEVFGHALNWLWREENYRPDLVIQLRPTSPIRFVKDLETCIYKLWHSDADSLRVVTEAFHTPFKMWKVENEHTPMEPLLEAPGIEECYNMPRQKLPKIYWQIGTLDVIRPSVILAQQSMSGSRILPFLISQEFAVDIDDLKSFERAESVLNKYDCVKFT